MTAILHIDDDWENVKESRYEYRFWIWNQLVKCACVRNANDFELQNKF